MTRAKAEPRWKPGSMPPTGYIAWHAWAEAQHKAGLRQVRCGRCVRYKYPQELSKIVDVGEATTRKRGGSVVLVRSPVCLGCAAKDGAR